ncbi:hypothetical protein D3C85_1499450 [compost metagenome]
MAGAHRRVEGEMKRLHVTQEEMMLWTAKLLIEGRVHASRNLHFDHYILFQCQHCSFNRFGQLNICILFQLEAVNDHFNVIFPGLIEFSFFRQ